MNHYAVMSGQIVDYFERVQLICNVFGRAKFVDVLAKSDVNWSKLSRARGYRATSYRLQRIISKQAKVPKSWRRFRQMLHIA